MLLGDISLMMGDSQNAMKSYLKEAADSPAHWYQAGQIAFREGDFVSACTYVRRGIAANPYIAEGLTGRTRINEHLYWHASNRNSPEWARRQTTYVRPCVTGQRQKSILWTGCLTQAPCCGNGPA